MDKQYYAPDGQLQSYGSGGVAEEGSAIDFSRYLGALRKYFWIILLFLVIGVIGAIAYLNVATPIYESVAVLKVEQRMVSEAPIMSGTGMATGAAMEDLRTLEMLGTIQTGFLSRSLMQQVADKLDLAKRADFLPKEVPADEKEEKLYKYLTKHTKATVVRGTRLIQLSFDHPNPDIATSVVGALIREYIELDIDQRLKAASGSLDYLQRERERIEKQLRESEQKLSEYTAKLGSISVSSAANPAAQMNIVGEQLRELNSRLALAKADRLKLAADYQQIEQVRNDPDALLQVQSITALPEVQEVRAKLSDLDGEIEKTRQRYGPRNPQLTELMSQRKGLNEALRAQALRSPQSVEIALKAAIQNQNSLEKETKTQEHKTIEMQGMAIQASVLQRQIDADKIAFEAVLQRYNEEQSMARAQPVFLQIQDPPSPGFQVYPKPLLVSLIAMFLALGAGCATVFILALLDTSFKSADDVEATVGVHVAAVIPLEGVSFRARGKTTVVEEDAKALAVLRDQHSALSEAFRTLRASFHLSEGDHPLILITSAVPGEGKSFCSLNLAASFAQQEAATVIVDADLRKPVIESRVFGEKEERTGLSDYLMGRADIEEIIRETSVPNLSIITAGHHYSNPSELLLRKERIQTLLNALEARFQRVVVDSAPVLAVSDTLNLARLFHTVGLVVRSHKTARRLILRAAGLLQRSCGAPISTVVLNMVPRRDAGYYYYYGESRGPNAKAHQDVQLQGSDAVKTS